MEGLGQSQHGAFAVRTVQNSGLLAPKGIAASADGRHLFVCDSGHHRIRLASIPGRSVLADADVVADGVDMIAFAGCGRKGWKDGLVTECCFNNPTGICERADGSIVVADTGNHCIRLIDRTAGGKVAVRTIGGSFAHRSWSTSSHFGLSRGSDIRNAGYADGVQSLFHSPCGVLDGEFGHVIVADTMNNCIRVLIAANRSREPWKARTLCGQQLPGYADGDCCSARFNQPQSLCWANGGRKDSFFVSDSGNGCVRQIGGCRITKTPDGDKFCVYDWVRTIEIDFIPQCIPQSHAGKRNSQPIVPTGIAYVPEPGRQNIAKLTVDLVVCDGGENVIKLVPLRNNMSVTRRHGRSPAAKGPTWSNAATCVEDHDGEASLREAEHLESNQDAVDNQRRSEYQIESDGGGCKCNCASALARVRHHGSDSTSQFWAIDN